MNPGSLLLLLFAFGLLLAVVQVGALTLAFDKLGLSPESAFLLLIASAAGSGINLPLFQVRADPPRPNELPPLAQLWRMPELAYFGRTVIALNVGGGLIPALFSAWLIRNHPLPAAEWLWAIALMSLIAFLISRPIPRLGIGMPVLVAPAAAALVAIAVNPEQSAPLAYVGGTLGVLIGADLLRLKDVRRLGAPVASIGGAGTFDGIFLTGIVAVLLS